MMLLLLLTLNNNSERNIKNRNKHILYLCFAFQFNNFNIFFHRACCSTLLNPLLKTITKEQHNLNHRGESKKKTRISHPNEGGSSVGRMWLTKWIKLSLNMNTAPESKSRQILTWYLFYLCLFSQVDLSLHSRSERCRNQFPNVDWSQWIVKMRGDWRSQDWRYEP